MLSAILSLLSLIKRYLVIDETMLDNFGKKIENSSYIHYHTLGCSVLVLCIIILRLFAVYGFIHLIFIPFWKKRNNKKDLKKTSAIPEKAVAKRAGQLLCLC